MASTLYYIHDPMCSWCWAFRPVWQETRRRLPSGVRTQNLLGGLAPNSDQPMPQALRDQITATWRRIQSEVPGTEFNFAFWRVCRPRRSTYPACRAVIAARRQGAAWEEEMILAIQQAYYLAARNPSQEETLLSLAREIGLDEERFGHDLRAPATELCLQEEIVFSRRIGARGFPSLFLDPGDGIRPLALDYRDPGAIVRQVRWLLKLDKSAAAD